MALSIVLAVGIIGYAVWAVRKIRRDRKNGSCCGGSCPNCSNKDYCNR